MLSALALVLAFSFQVPKPSQAPTPGTETPAQEFRRISEELYSGDCPQLGSKLRRVLKQALKNPELPEADRIRGMMDLGDELVEAGEVEDAISTL